MFTRDRIPNWLSTLGVIAIILAVMPWFEYRSGVSDPAVGKHVLANPEDMPFTENYTFGWQVSPLARWHKELELKNNNGRVTVSRSQGFELAWV